jgi:hypothetical protein
MILDEASNILKASAMKPLRGHFDGQHIILDEPAPRELTPNTPVEVVIVRTQEELLRDYQAFVKAMWERPLPPDFKPAGRQWKREDA